MANEQIDKVTLAISEDSDHLIRLAVKGVEDELNRLVVDINAKALFPDAATGSLVVHSDTAIPAGGAAGTGVMVSSTANFGVFFGSGAPTLSAAKGSLYMRSDGSGTADRIYVNTNGTTTWTAVSTVA